MNLSKGSVVKPEVRMENILTLKFSFSTPQYFIFKLPVAEIWRCPARDTR